MFFSNQTKSEADMKEKRTTISIENFPADVAELGRDLWMAGLGAVVTVEEEGTKFYETLTNTSTKRLAGLQDEAARLFDDLVKRGEKAERRGREQITERVEVVKKEMAAVREGVTARPRKLAEKIEQTVAESVEKTLERLDVPTRTEVRTLTKTVERLTEQVAQLAASLEK